eukprot:TRINITY_DN331_c0_g1_i4.p1 TRINITY_DN331_c0_g1~~TRINITY_DN331_c0_g1_i4.p1  ORF type:complete len:679 (-),score=67.83 TRINITY_DN331_c0_g1_i4:127-2124(-)
MSCQVFEGLVTLSEQLTSSGQYVPGIRCLEAACSLVTYPVMGVTLITMSCQVFEGLVTLSEQLTSSGQYVPGIRCLEAACSLVTYPVMEAKLRLRIVQLLLAHTDHVVEATQHVKKAQLSLSRQPTEVHLKLLALDLLGQCYKLEGELKLQHHTYEQALQLINNSANVQMPPLYSSYFQLQLLKSTYALGQINAAFEMASVGETFCEKNTLNLQAIIFALIQIQLRIRMGQNVKEDVKKVESRLLEFQDFSEQDKSNIKIRLGILTLLNHLKQDSYLELTETKTPTAQQVLKIESIVQLEEQIEQNIQQQQQQQYKQSKNDQQFKLLPLEGCQLLCLFYILSIQIYLPLCISSAIDYQTKADVLVKQMMDSLDIRNDQNQQNLPSTKLWLFSFPLILKFQLLITQTQISNCTTNYGDMCNVLVEMIDLISRFPSCLGQFVPTLHILIGLYFHAIDEYDDGASHFQRAGEYVQDQKYWSDIQLIWRVGTCLCELSKDEESCNYSALAQILGDCTGQIGNVDLGVKSLGLIGSSIAYIVQGNRDEAKLRLGRALRTLNSKLQNGHMMVQVMGLLAPLFLEDGDIDAAKYLMQSTQVLQTRLKDVAVQYVGRACQLRYLQAANKVQQQEATRFSLNKKAKQLEVAVSEAKQKEDQNCKIREWDLQIEE